MSDFLRAQPRNKQSHLWARGLKKMLSFSGARQYGKEYQDFVRTLLLAHTHTAQGSALHAAVLLSEVNLQRLKDSKTRKHIPAYLDLCRLLAERAAITEDEKDIQQQRILLPKITEAVLSTPELKTALIEALAFAAFDLAERTRDEELFRHAETLLYLTEKDKPKVKYMRQFAIAHFEMVSLRSVIMKDLNHEQLRSLWGRSIGVLDSVLKGKLTILRRYTWALACCAHQLKDLNAARHVVSIYKDMADVWFRYRCGDSTTTTWGPQDSLKYIFALRTVHQITGDPEDLAPVSDFLKHALAFKRSVYPGALRTWVPEAWTICLLAFELEGNIHTHRWAILNLKQLVYDLPLQHTTRVSLVVTLARMLTIDDPTKLWDATRRWAVALCDEMIKLPSTTLEDQGLLYLAAQAASRSPYICDHLPMKALIRAVEDGQRALALLNEDHPKRAEAMTELAISLRVLHQRQSDAERLLTRALELLTAAKDLPVEPLYKPLIWANLGLCIQLGHVLRSEEQSRSIECFNESLKLLPVRSPHRPFIQEWLNQATASDMVLNR
jgi:hypothetical protein